MAYFIRFDWAIKRLLRNKANFDILEGFLSELLKEDVAIQEIIESESNQISAEDKQNRVDLLVKNAKGELIIIEVQQNYESDYFHRMVYGSSKLIVEQLYKGDEYSKIKKIISIHIAYFDLGQGNDYVYHGKTQFTGMHEGGTLQLSESQKKLFLQDELYQIFPEFYILKVNNFNDLAKDTLDEWIYFLKNNEIKAQFKAKGLQKAREELNLMKMNDDEREGYEVFLHLRRVRNNEISSALMIGFDDGFEKGQKEKELEKNREKEVADKKLIQKLLSKGFSDDEIAKMMEIEIFMVQQLKSSLE